ncbi:metallophosphoesterase [Bacteriovoracaceae bacterium]|nr:metallophosphoesterase [Bacteriovoracaceae bacterium]
MRTIFVGDIHGCFEEFQLLLKKLNYHKDDRLILLGDLINKGPHSVEVLKFVKSNKIEFILGNHEYGFLKYVKSKKTHIDSFNKIKEELGDELNSWVDFLASKPFYIESEDWIAVHGGIEPDKSLENSDPAILSSIRLIEGKPWYDYYQGDRTVLFGHWAKLGLFFGEKIICLDSRCCYGGTLSAFIWEEKKLVQLKALDKYFDMDEEL